MHAPAPAPRRTQRRHDHGDRLRVRRARHDSRGAHHLPSGEPGEGAAPRLARATGGRQERGGLPGRAGGRNAEPRAAARVDGVRRGTQRRPGRRPAAPAGGDTAPATQVVEPGSYVLVCWIPSLDGTPHVMKGMLHPLVVTASPAPVAPAPAADVTITLTDYAFLLPHPFPAGHHVVRVDNAGAQGHEVVIAALAPGKTLHDFIAWEQGGEKGPLPTGQWLGGVTTLDAGGHSQFATTLAPGSYLLLCFWPDAKDGKPHTMHGMGKEIRVG